MYFYYSLYCLWSCCFYKILWVWKYKKRDEDWILRHFIKRENNKIKRNLNNALWHQIKNVFESLHRHSTYQNLMYSRLKSAKKCNLEKKNCLPHKWTSKKISLTHSNYVPSSSLAPYTLFFHFSAQSVRRSSLVPNNFFLFFKNYMKNKKNPSVKKYYAYFFIAQLMSHSLTFFCLFNGQS